MAYETNNRPDSGRATHDASDSAQVSRPARDLSPWSARRALTEQMNQPQRIERREEVPWRRHANSPPPAREATRRGGRDPSPARHQKERARETLETERPQDNLRDRKSQELDATSSRISRDRELSPEPYRKPRERADEKPRDRSRNRHRDRSTDRRRAKSRERRHNPSSDRRRDRSPDTKRDRSRDRRRDRSRDRKRDHSTEGTRDKRRNRSRDSTYDRKRDRSREGTHDKQRDRSRHDTRDRRRDRSREGRHDRKRDRSREGTQDRKRDRSREDTSDKKRDRSRDDKHRRRDHSRDRRRHRSRSPRHNDDRRRRDRNRSPSTSSSPPPSKRPRRTRSPSPHRRAKAPLPSQELSFRGTDNAALPPSKYGGAPPTLEKPNFKPTGLLAKAANKVEGTKISLKYHEPPEARKPPPSAAWRIFVFKGEDVVDTIELHMRSCWLLGRAYEVVDYVLEHPSSSSQHAVIQFRYSVKTTEDEFGVKSQKGRVKPYVIDLESSNGTELNGKRIEASRYFELRDKDILTFAGSEREYVVVLPPAEKKQESA